MKSVRPLQINMKMIFRFLSIGIAVLAIGSLLVFPKASTVRAANGVPRPDHVVIVIEENHDYSQIIGNACCTYINAQANAGALMTNSHGVEHPSEPNYLDLFSGSNQGVTDDSCPHTFTTANLAQELIAAGFTFGSYSENLPAVGSTVCTATGGYARKHNPWVNFSNVPTSTNMPLTSFPTDFTQLPDVSIIVPNLCNDMHDCSTTTGDAWVQSHMDAYIQWAKTHNSLFILTFDENSGTSGNLIATIFEGPMVVPGQYNENINHFNMLRTLEDMYGLPYAGQSASVASIIDIWTGAPVLTPTPTRTNTPVPPSSTPTITNTPGGPTSTRTNTPLPTLTRTITPTAGSNTTVSFQNGVLPSASYAGMIDTMLKQGSATSNFGTGTTLEVDGDDGSGVDKSILLKWDTSTIPTSAMATSATLTFKVVDTTASAYQLYQVKQNWAETQATWNIFATGSNWQTAGAFGANDRGTTVLGTAGPATSGTFYTITLNTAGLAIVQGWINNPISNFGLIIGNASNTDGLDFSSSEVTTLTDRPKLTVIYH